MHLTLLGHALRVHGPRVLFVNLLVLAASLMPELLPPALTPRGMLGVQVLANGFLFVAALSVALLASAIVAADSPVKADAFWRTRAIAPGWLLAVQLFLIGAGLVALPLIVLAFTGIASGLHGESLWRSLARPAAALLLLAGVGFLAAAFWRRPWLGLLCLCGIALGAVGMELDTRLWLASRSLQTGRDFVDGLQSTRLLLGGVAAGLGLAAGVWELYAHGRRRSALLRVGVGAGMACVLIVLWPIDLRPRPRLAAASLKPLAELGTLSGRSYSWKTGQALRLELRLDDYWKSDERFVRLLRVLPKTEGAPEPDRKTQAWTWNSAFSPATAAASQMADFDVPAWSSTLGIPAPVEWRGRFWCEAGRVITREIPVHDGLSYRQGYWAARVRLNRDSRSQVTVSLVLQKPPLRQRLLRRLSEESPQLIDDSLPGDRPRMHLKGQSSPSARGEFEQTISVYEFIDPAGEVWAEEKIQAWLKALHLRHRYLETDERFAVDVAVRLPPSEPAR